MAHPQPPHSPPAPVAATVRPTLSMELFPPRSGPAAAATWGRIDTLLSTSPDFVSVTYRPRFVTDPRDDEGGAGVRVVREHNPAEDVVAHVLATSRVPLMAHLTCIGYRKRDVVEIVTLFLRMGVRRFLALRGDPPAGTAADELAGELAHADDLVRVIREVEAEYFDDGRQHVTVAVAAYPATSDHAQAIEVLAAKQDAGADMAITQVFYDSQDYAALLRGATYAGITMPILPGLIPLTDLGRLTRLEALTGVRVPAHLRDALGSASGARLVGRGLDATLTLATELLAEGAPGLHLYTFNRTRPALDVVSHLRLGGILTGSPPDPQMREAIERGYLQATPGGMPAFLQEAHSPLSPPSASRPGHPGTASLSVSTSTVKETV
ncbi:methylenetetrahydrofolate reductase [Actinomyces slackii]|uniref:Methylenetetrahydrofolate reductase n=1 Tax=Actinomyces slackii TaxID=52774 RepID=A0A3S4SUP6_9ACTO|nr:methylenetetrahydrofolate reductase [Actinomyces slackii]VEG75516.1 5,10-methylenetetrahydrofolate reductase [Actinomyces slackii]